jgi:hypothetical protein
MEIQQSQNDWRSIVGGLGHPLPKLSKAEKQKLRALLQGLQLDKQDSAWVIRICLLTGTPLPSAVLNPQIIAKAVPAKEIARHL